MLAFELGPRKLAGSQKRDVVGNRGMDSVNRRSAREDFFPHRAGSVTRAFRKCGLIALANRNRLDVRRVVRGSDQLQPLQARVSLLADDDVVVHGDA